MDWNLGKWVLLWVIVLLQIHQHRCCFEDERMSLLGFKASLKSPGVNVDHLLPSWVDEKESTDCCGWERVTCNSTSGHVIHLSLAHLLKSFNEYDDQPIDQPSGLLNLSFFFRFKELQSLDLSHNSFLGLVENEDFGRLSILKKLETLFLDYNAFNNSILPYLSELTSLKILSLHFNGLKGSFPAQELATLENLEMLDIGGNELYGTLTTQDLESLSRLKKLKTLDLGGNQFNKSIIQSLSALPSLKNLTLVYNQLEGSFPAQELSNLENLESLDVSFNGLNGSLTMQGITRSHPKL